MKNKLILAIGASLLCCSVLQAQNPGFGSEVSIDVNYIDLGNTPESGSGYGIAYRRNLIGSRFAVGARLGRASAPGVNDSVSGKFFSYGKRSQRTTIDLTVSYDFLKSERHALRLGVGPSIWSRKDDRPLGIHLFFEGLEAPKLVDVEFLRRDEIEENFGYHLTGEYSYSFTPRILAKANVGFAQFKATGFNPMAGIGIGYRF